MKRRRSPPIFATFPRLWCRRLRASSWRAASAVFLVLVLLYAFGTLVAGSSAAAAAFIPLAYTMIPNGGAFLLALLMAILAALAGGYYWLHSGNPDALRKIVLQQCVPHQQQQQNPSPCAEVNLKGGYVLFKDRNGPLQYLLMPTYRINGTESPLLLEPLTPNFFWQAWQGREIMSQRHGAPVPDNAVSLAINSRSGRTQNHFHIHISCLRPDVRAQLDKDAAAISSRWLPLPGGLQGHEYLARRVTEAELAQRSPFLMLAEEVPEAREHMGRFALAMAQQSDGSLVLLATERNLLTLNRASAEEIQYHRCAILNANH